MQNEIKSIDTVEILVAENSKSDRLFIEEAFGTLDLNVRLHFFYDGQELLDYLHAAYHELGQTRLPTIILMDLNMPRMNGFETIKALREDALLRVLPVVVLSTVHNPIQIARAYTYGINAYIKKPSHFDDLVASMDRFAEFWFNDAVLPVTAIPL